jgi:alpha-D-xyloside xylohydrolase
LDYQTGKTYRGAQWHRISAGAVPVVLLVKDHAAIPHINLAQSTAEMNWNEIELRVFSTDDAPASAFFALPKGKLQALKLEAEQKNFALKNDPLPGKVNWRVRRFEMK